MDKTKIKKERSPAQIEAFNKMVESRRQKIQQRETQKEKDKELKKLNRKRKVEKENEK